MINLFKIWNLLNKKLKKNFIILLFLMLMGTIFEILSVSALIPLLGIITDENNKILQIINAYNLNYLYNFLEFNRVVYIFASVYLCKIFFLVFLIHFQNNFIYSFYSYLANRLFKHYVYKDYLFHLQVNSSILIRNLSSEIHQCTVGYTAAFLNFLLEILVIFGLSLVLLFFQPINTLVSITGVVILFSILFFLGKKKLSNLGVERQKFSFINLKFINETFGGIKELKVSTNEEKIVNDFNINTIKIQKINYLFGFINQIPKLALELFLISVIFIIFLTLKNLNYSLNEMILYFGILGAVFIRILPGVNRLLVASFSLSFYKASVDVISNEILNEKPSNNLIEQITDPEDKLSFEKNIELKNLSFKYPNREEQIFNEINLKIHKGEMVGIIGKTGTGKSTLVDIIIGLLQPTSGSITVDGKKIEKNLKGWMNKIGYVSQNVFLNDDSIKKNIAFYYKDENILLDKINKSIRDSQLEDFINNSNLGLDLNVGDKGLNISGGQRQRVGIARSLYKNSEILIFDEPTNSLDRKTEESFLKVINTLKSKKTIIIISHNETILTNCDSIYNISDSEIFKKSNA